MVDRVNRFCLCKLAVILGLLSVALPGGAAELKDPTRPPPGFSQKALTQARTQAAHNDPLEAVPAAAPKHVSSLFLLADQPWALVDGVIVRPGDPLADGRVSRIDAQGVWIKTRQGVKQIKWLPEIVKTPPAAGMETP